MIYEVVPTSKIQDLVRQDLLLKIAENAEKISGLGYQFKMTSALEDALRDIIKRQEKFINSPESRKKIAQSPAQ